MADQAQVHWWYRARRALVADVLAGELAPGATAIDVGCGTGDNLGALEDVAGRTVVGVELSPTPSATPRGPRPAACGPAWPGPSSCRSRPGAPTWSPAWTSSSTSTTTPPWPSTAGCCGPAAWSLLTVPAYQWLWSHHDDWAAHRRRYTAADAGRRRDRGPGSGPLRTTYFNSFLVPPAAVLRRTPARRLVKVEQDEVGASSPAVDRVMTGLAGPSGAGPGGAGVPFGLSIASSPTDLNAAAPATRQVGQPR